MPKAKLAVVITPMAASAPMIRRRVTRPTASPEAEAPQAGADEEVEADQRAQIAAPPKMAWERPWPM